MEAITLKAMPFDANEIIDPVTGETTFDRVAYSRDLADWLRTYFSNGLLVRGVNNLSTEFQVVHKEALTLTVKPGAICINGRTGWNESEQNITVTMGGTSPRIDRVVAELNIPSDRGIYLKVLEGTPAVSPVAPTLTQTEDVYQIPLAQIKIAASSAVIESVADERQNYISACTLVPTANQAEVIQVSEELQVLYGLSGSDANADGCFQKVPTVADRSNLASYMAFVANTNADSINSAFGKNNEDLVTNLGKQLAMYAWFKGDSKTTYPFTELFKANKLSEVFMNRNMFDEMYANLNIRTLIANSSYANTFTYTGEKDVAYTPRVFDFGLGNFVITYQVRGNRQVYDGLANDYFGGKHICDASYSDSHTTFEASIVATGSMLELSNVLFTTTGGTVTTSFQVKNSSDAVVGSLSTSSNSQTLKIPTVKGGTYKMVFKTDTNQAGVGYYTELKIGKVIMA